MQKHLTKTGIGEGRIHNYRWILTDVCSDYIFSPTSIHGDFIGGTGIFGKDGNSYGIVITANEICTRVGAGSMITCGGNGGMFAGHYGFGQSGFKILTDGTLIEMINPPNSMGVDIETINSRGVLGGSCNTGSEEFGVVWEERTPETYEQVRSVTFVDDDGNKFGQDHFGQPVRISENIVFGGKGTIISGTRVGDLLINSPSGIVIWHHGGSVEAVPIRGYVRYQAIGWSECKKILGFGVTPSGQIQHWIYDSKIGITVLSGVSLEDGILIKEISAISLTGKLVGTAIQNDKRYLVELF